MKATVTIKQGRKIHVKDVDGEKKDILGLCRELARHFKKKAHSKVFVHFENEGSPVQIKF